MARTLFASLKAAFGRSRPAPPSAEIKPETGSASKAAASLARAGGPVLQELIQGNYGGIQAGPWHRWVDAKWLGPYTPQWVPHWARKLMRRDPQIALAMAAVKAPFFGISYRAVGGSPRARAFLRSALLERPIFEQLKWSILNALDFGYQSHEKLWDIQDVEIQVDAHEDDETPDEIPETAPTKESKSGAPVKERIGQAYVLRELHDIDPERVGIVVDGTGRFSGIQVDGTSRLPADKVVHAVNQREFRNWWGTSILDHSYQPWYWCNFLYLWLMRYEESKANPPLIGWAPAEPRYDETLPRDTQTPKYGLDELNANLITLRGGGAITLPDERDEKGNLRWSVKVLEDPGRAEQFVTVINHLQALKMRGLFVPERTITQDTQVGSYASSDVALSVFFSNLEVIKRFLVLRTINEEVVEPLIRYNFGASESMPHVEATELSRENRQLLGEVVMKILDSPRTLPNGKIYTAAGTLDIERSFDALNFPRIPPHVVATDAPQKPGPGAGSSVGAGQKPGEAGAAGANQSGAAGLARGPADPSIVVLNMRENSPGDTLATGLAPLVERVARVAEAVKAQPAPVVNVAAAKAPVVNVAAPNVNVQPPNVNVAGPTVNVAAPNVNVQPFSESVAEQLAGAARSMNRIAEVLGLQKSIEITGASGVKMKGEIRPGV